MQESSLPPLIMTTDKDSYAHATIARRKPHIIDQILSLNDYSPEIQHKLKIFKAEIANEIIHPLDDESGDKAIWNGELSHWQGKTWFEIPWLLAEFYFYRRILEIVAYFKPGPGFMKDPYEGLKSTELFDALKTFNQMYKGFTGDPTFVNFEEICLHVLWGNRGDLSSMTKYIPAIDSRSERVIVNHIKTFYDFLEAKPRTIVYIFDNTGIELIFDLAFIDFLLQHRLASKITCYLKNLPVFVSDAMLKDVIAALDILKNSPSKKGQQLARRLLRAEQAERIEFKTPPFLTYPRDFRQMPPELNQEIAGHDVAILKGDLNFRRLMGDRHWPPTTAISIAAGYYPTNFLSFRTIKSELILGLPMDLYVTLNQNAEKDWLTNGKRGMIAFHQRNDPD